MDGEDREACLGKYTAVLNPLLQEQGGSGLLGAFSWAGWELAVVQREFYGRLLPSAGRF